MYGTLSVNDLLATTQQTVGEFDENRFADAIKALFEAHNKIMTSLFADVLDRTTEKEGVYGTPDSMEMTKTDEFGRPDTQKISPGAVWGLPLESWQGSIGWTRKYFENATVAEVAAQFLAIRTADAQRVAIETKRALFTPTDYTFNDYLVARRQVLPLQVRALVNADGLALPVGPNGEVFPTNHTHYLGTSSFAQADLIALLETVLEHYATGDACIYINRAQESVVRGFANFTPYLNAGIVGPTTASEAPGRSLNAVSLYNRAIGLFNGAEVWVKPWMPPAYLFAFLRDQPKPLAMRTRPNRPGDLALVAEDEKYPLRARTYEREFGIGAMERTNGAVLYTTSSTYASPALPA